MPILTDTAILYVWKLLRKRPPTLHRAEMTPLYSPLSKWSIYAINITYPVHAYFEILEPRFKDASTRLRTLGSSQYHISFLYKKKTSSQYTYLPYSN